MSPDLQALNDRLTTAGAALLNAVHHAGGYHVYDPLHQQRIARAMHDLEMAVVESNNATHHEEPTL